MRRRLVFSFVIILSLLVLRVRGQSSNADSLRQVLERHTRLDEARVDALNDLANAIYRQETVEAEALLRQSDEIADGLHYRKGKSASLLVRGFICQRSDNKRALDCFRQSLRLAEEVGDPYGTCRSLLAISGVLMDLGDTASCDESLGKALAIARETGDRRMEMNILYQWARNLRRAGDLSGTLEKARKAMALAESIGDDQSLSACLGLVAVMHQGQGNLVMALDNYLSVLKIKERLGDEQGMYYPLVNIAGVQSEQGDFESASRTIQAAYAIVREAGDSLRMSACLANMGNIHLSAESPSALQYFEEALAMVEENNVGLRINILMGIGTIHTHAGEFDKASACLAEALRLAEEARMQVACAEVWIKLGTLSFARKQYETALDYVRKALLVAEETNRMELMRDCRKLLSDLYVAMRVFDKAYENHVAYKSISDSLFNEKNTRKIALMESSYTYEKEKREMEVQMQDHELRIRSQRLVILFLVLLSLLVGVLSFFIYWYNKLKKRVLRLTIEQVSRELETNQKAMTEATLKLVQGSEREANHIKVLENIKMSTLEKGQDEIRSLIADYKLKSYGSNWEEFDILFKKVDAAFYERLNSRYPNLTPNERRLCVFLKLNMSNNHISQVTFQSDEALKKARLRLRKKLEIERDVNLAAFIQNL